MGHCLFRDKCLAVLVIHSRRVRIAEQARFALFGHRRAASPVLYCVSLARYDGLLADRPAILSTTPSSTQGLRQIMQDVAASAQGQEHDNRLKLLLVHR